MSEFFSLSFFVAPSKNKTLSPPSRSLALPSTFAHPSDFVPFQSSWVQCPVSEDHEGFEKSTFEHSAAQASNASVHEE